MNMSKRLLLIGAATLLSNAALADLILEDGDAGDLTATAQIVAAGADVISGSSDTADVDLYGFGWGGGDFSAITTSTDDPQLYLFDSNGFGILENDDGAGFPNSLISILDLAAGTYFIGIAGYNAEPFSATGAIFEDTCCGDQLPTGPGAGDPLSGWTPDNGGGAGEYTITFNADTVAAAVPEPGTLALLGLGLLGVGLGRRRKTT